MIKKKKYRGLLWVLLVLTLFAGSVMTCFGATTAVSAESALKETGAYLYKMVNKPQVGSIGGEWAVIGLARSQEEVAATYYETYYSTVENYLKTCKGILHDKKYTEYSRVILALTAIGKDPTMVGGYNLLEKLADFEMVKWQGINGSIWALIALDSGNYEIPKIATVKQQTTRDLLIKEILNNELAGGGFTLAGATPDVDMTAMAMQALAPYKSKSEVHAAIERGLTLLSKEQEANGGFSSLSSSNLEASAQVLVALCSLGINPDTDNRFIKNGKTVVDGILNYYSTGGGFKHTENGGGDSQMSSEQGYYALVAYQRFQTGKTALYNMTDVKKSSTTATVDRKTEITITIDGEETAFTTQSGVPFLDNRGRTQVPLRVTMEHYGAIVTWDNVARSATVEKDGAKVIVPVGELYLLKNGAKIAIDTEAQMKDDRIYLPIRAVVEALGGTVAWENESKTVRIKK